MNPEQIKAQIRKLNWIDKIGIYRWINEEVAGYHGIGADRSLQIRHEIERICKVPGTGKASSHPPRAKSHRTGGLAANPKKSGSDFVGKN